MKRLFISSTTILIAWDCGVFVIIGIFREATNRDVYYNQQDMNYIREKITVSIMRQQIDLEVTMKLDKYQYQLADGRKPDDESINSVVALMIPRDSRLCTSQKNKLPSFFFRTYMMDNLVQLGFEDDSGLTYSRKTKHVHDWCNDVFGQDKLFMPIHIVNSRFILAVIYIQEKRILFYDRELSTDIVFKYKTILINYLRKEYWMKTTLELPLEWTLDNSRPDQAITYDNDGTLVFRYYYMELLPRQVSIAT